MPTYKAPLRDMRFLLHEVWNISELTRNIPPFAEFTPDIIDTVLEEAAKLNETLLQPLNQRGDQQHCQFNNGMVTTPTGFKEAYRTYREAGWSALTAVPEFGGQGFPHMVGICMEEMLCSSNVSFCLYAGLTMAVSQAIYENATAQIKEKFLPKMITGQWTGVMCLTEAHCGTDLGLLRTKAEPNSDGSYSISGTKIFITAGEHDLAENIIHLVLARVPGGPAGTKGISTFIVPKIQVNDDGSLGKSNGVTCGSIEHKMGIKASSTCVINYDHARGFLLGELHQGMPVMFRVMNIERLAIGMQGLGLAEVSYQNARNYAQQRLQGRAPMGPKYPEKYADPIIVHPDVRRMLLTMKAFIEGARALAVWTSRQIDISQHHPDNSKCERAAAMVQLFTPIIKTFFSDNGLDACNLGLQVLGGHGYISESGMEQFVRDARIAQIYEGTNGIQAFDLVKRKLVMNRGEWVHLFIAEVRQFIGAVQSQRELASFLTGLQQALTLLEQTSQWILHASKNNNAEIGAAAVEYLHLFGLTAFAYMWLKMASVAVEKTQAKNDFYAVKIHTAKFFFDRMLPKIHCLATIIQSGCSSLMETADENM